jgi:uncharacterized membrane protein YdjX (TVP38/TMEM64 family)
MKLEVSRKATLLTVAAIALAVSAYAVIPAVRASVNAAVAILLTTDTQRAIEGFRDYLRGFGVLAPVVSAALMVLQAVVAPLPAFVITFTNGLLFGWAWGAALSWSSAMLGAALCFGLARALGRPAVEKLVGGTRALEVSDLFFRRYGRRAVLVSRLLPFVSFDVVSYGAGLTPTPFVPFLVATGIGQLPATLLYSYLGQNLAGSVRVLFWVFSVTVAIAVLAWSIGPVFLRRLRASQGEAAAEAE